VRRTEAPAVAEELADFDEAELQDLFEEQDYVADENVRTTTLLALRLGRPLLVEGHPGAGKTELAKVLAAGLGTELIRLQCYEGLAAEEALYEWNYAKQLLAVEAGETEEEGVFTEEFLLERPLLRALRGATDGLPPVLLVDEVDRADEEFEALLLEVLSDFQASVPELGTVAAETRPIVIVTSNRTRSLSDALKRRCLYLHLELPSVETEREILTRKVPELDAAVAAQLTAVAHRLREEPLLKPPGAAETLDWARALTTLRGEDTPGDLGAAELRSTLGTLLKEVEDVERVDDAMVEELLAAAEAAAQGD
jgi:MoxR-like ATPase